MAETPSAVEILDALDAGYLVVDSDGRVTQVSPFAEALLQAQGWSPGTPVGALVRCRNEAILGGADSALGRCISDGEAWSSGLHGIEVEVNGENLPVNLHLAKVGDYALISITGAGDLREVLEAHDALVSITSHELKTPLTAIKAMSELLLAYDLEEVQRKDMIGDIYRQAERLEALIREILDASQIDSGRMPLDMRAVNLRDVVAEVLDELQTQTESTPLKIEVPTTVPHVTADHAKLAQIFVNLITNAVKYSPEGAPVTIRAVKRDSMVRVEVTDKGVGIREEDLGRLFKRFQRIQDPATRSAKGTGLGLYIVKGLVELHGGTVEVSSRHGEGSTFSFTLPIAVSA
ncbi:MAG: sensor histidine kinase [Candidatus Dormibacteria bacterium]